MGDDRHHSHSNRHPPREKKRTGYLLTQDAYHLLYGLRERVRLTTTLARSRSELSNRYEPTPPVGDWAYILEKWTEELDFVVKHTTWQPR
ncbi:XAC0095 family protein [Pseudoxanthomonas beigongshangi]|uniref:XAC0095 family protein n=1 Tax=Pseudoxanthomonas beigongshangi TaxID=2782537 RepID=UPI00193BC7EF|nr:hypothetical protein [Pseudoxanthomonas beigongshangi]